jgi:hypothetical protein
MLLCASSVDPELLFSLARLGPKDEALIGKWRYPVHRSFRCHNTKASRLEAEVDLKGRHLGETDCQVEFYRG